MKHRFFTILCAVSLAMCAAICALWWSSYWRDLHLVRMTTHHSYEIEVSQGEMEMDNSCYAKPIAPNERGWFGEASSTLQDLIAGIPSIREQVVWRFYVSMSEPENGSFIPRGLMLLPCWFPALMTALLPFMWAWIKWKNRNP
jgi:hypothetical protein